MAGWSPGPGHAVTEASCSAKMQVNAAQTNMKIPPLFLAVAVFAGGIGTSLAQVYSVNIVGYINLVVQPGLNLIVNQLQCTDDDLNSFMPSPPDGTVVFRFDPVAQAYQDGVTFLDGVGWYPSSGKTPDRVKSIPLGEGFFVQIPGSMPVNLFFVGEVELISCNPLPGNYSLKGSIIPQGAPLSTDLAFPQLDGDTVYQWDVGLQRFRIPLAYSNANAWQPKEPVIAVGEGFLLFRDPVLASSNQQWCRSFAVGPSPLPAGVAAKSLAVAPSITRLLLSKGTATLQINNPAGGAYDVQFSNDGVVWNTLAEKQTGTPWSAPFTAGAKGYFRLSNSKG